MIIGLFINAILFEMNFCNTSIENSLSQAFPFTL